MSVLAEVLDSLRSMNQWQLLLAFLACMGYALSQGRLVEPKGRRIAALLALVAAIGFGFESADWTHAAMLLAFAVAGLGLFVGVTWLVSRALGVSDPGRAPAPGDTEPAALPTPASARKRLPARPGPAHSH